MKTTIIRPFALLAIILLVTSCVKENHSVRFRNEYSEQIYNVEIGSASIGDVGSGSTSGYKAINTGNFSISGKTASGQVLKGSGQISGRGKHKWTLTLNGAGETSFSEDK